MANTKISALTSSTTPLAGTEVLPIVQSSATVQVAVSDLTAGRSVSMSAGTISSGNLNFSSTAQRITGDFSNGTLTNRLAFQTNTVNSGTSLHVIPNGTNTFTGLKLEGDASIANGSRFTFDLVGSTDARIGSSKYGTGTYLPITFYTGGSERVQIDISGNLGIGTNSPNSYGAGYTTATVNNTTGSVFDLNVAGTRTATFYALNDGTIRVGSQAAFPLQLIVSGAERMRIDTAGIVTMSAYGAGAATFSAAGVISSVSDETWKIKDGVPVDPDSMLKKLEPGYWYYNDEKKETFGVDRQLGFYAQNVNAAIGPEAAPTPEENKPWGYYDRSVLAVTVMSLQKALATIESLTARIEALES
jgi:hypothetical protein